MMTSNVGDMVQALMLRRTTASASAELNRLSEEMASGPGLRPAEPFPRQLHPDGGSGAGAGDERRLQVQQHRRGPVRRRPAGRAQGAQSTVGAASTRFLNTTPTGDTTQLRIVYTRRDRGWSRWWAR